MARPAKRAEVIAAAFRDYHARKISLVALLACIAGMRDNGKPLM